MKKFGMSCHVISLRVPVVMEMALNLFFGGGGRVFTSSFINGEVNKTLWSFIMHVLLIKQSRELANAITNLLNNGNEILCKQILHEEGFIDSESFMLHFFCTIIIVLFFSYLYCAISLCLLLCISCLQLAVDT